MTYKEHVETVIKHLKLFAESKDTDLVLLRNHLSGIIDDIEEEESFLKWECNECDHTWKASPFNTFVICEECESEDIGHY